MQAKMFANMRLVALLLLCAAAVRPETARFKQRCLRDLVAQVPGILATQDRATGRFGSGVWIVNDQNVLLPLAAAWSYRDASNPYYHNTRLLEAITAGGDALIAAQDRIGKWEFRKKDNSTWGPIYMPWTYSRWVRAYSMIRDAMPADRRARWEKGLRLGYSGIARDLQTAGVQNIPAHHAMGLWFAAQVSHEPAWREVAVKFLHKVVEAQFPDGYWTEHKGPVVQYGFVYVDALGIYYAVSKDAAVLPALRKTAVFHSYFTYPDGTDVETVDERNPYHGGVRMPNVGFTFSPEGRGYLMRQLALRSGRIPADEAAALLLWGQEGEARNVVAGDFDFTLGKGDAAVRRRGPWFLVVSAMTAAQSNSRWIQDRQNFVSVWHEKAGLILGGGNTKMQPRWSNFTLGDVDLLRHKAGDEKPNFIAPAGLIHVPTAARLLDFGVELDYGKARGQVRLAIEGSRLEYVVSGSQALAPHVTLLPRTGSPLISAVGGSEELADKAFVWSAPGAWIELAGVRYTLPQGAVVRWPVLPHNPYRKDGSAEAREGHIVIDLPAGESRIGIQVNQ